MRMVCTLFIITFATLANAADTVDLGRGELPLVVPESYDAKKPAPWYCYSTDTHQTVGAQDAYMKFGKLADEFGFLYVAPTGTKEESERNHPFWNATKACCNFYGSEVDDVAYISNIIKEIKQRYSVDPNRVYLIGHSNGGFMSHRMAMEHPEVIAAIASLAGAAPSELSGPKPNRPVNILQIHGTKDGTIKYAGGDIQDVAYPSAQETVEKWVAYNGWSSDAKKSSKKMDLDKRLDGNETEITRYMKGAAELWTIVDGKHVPTLSTEFNRKVIEWLMAHPKAELK